MDESVDGGLEIDDGMEDAVHEPLLPAPHAHLGLPVSGNTAKVPRRWPLTGTIHARQTCFYGLSGSATIVRNR